MIKAPKFPFAFSEKRGYENNMSSKDVIRFHLTNLFMTNPGERIDDENYGIGIRRFLFEPNVSQITQNIKQLIRNKISQYMPYIEVQALDVISIEEKNSLGISLKYFIPDSADIDVISFEVEAMETASSPSY